MSFIQQYLAEATQILQQLDTQAIDHVVALLVETRARGGRLFILGVGGSAGTLRMRSMIFVKLLVWKPTLPRTMSRSWLRARTMRAGPACLSVAADEPTARRGYWCACSR